MGTDLGQDTGTATINATSKVVELFLQLLAKVYERSIRERDPRYMLERAKFDEYKEKKAQERMGRELDVMGGYVKLKQLQKSGEQLEVVNVKGMEARDVERFRELCEQGGIVYSGSKVERDDGKVDVNLVVRAKDLEQVKEVTERMNDEKRVEAIDQRISEIWKKTEVTDQDVANIKDLQEQKAEIQRKACIDLNSRQAGVILGNAERVVPEKGITLSEALDRNTGRHLDKDVETIVADSQDPSRYVRCHGHVDNYRGKDYVKTEYDVYRGGEKVLSTHDGRFDGRPRDYWDVQKAAIMEAGGFKGKVFKFYNEAEYQRWAEYVKRENEGELSHLRPGERTPEEYERAIEELHQQLKERGAEVDDQGQVWFVGSGEEERKPLPSVHEVPPEEKDSISECRVIKDQIDVLQQKRAVESELVQAKAYAMVVDDNTPPERRVEIEERVSAAEGKLKELNERESSLYQQRQEINAVQAERSMNRDREEGRIPELEGGERQDPEVGEGSERSLDDWKDVVRDDRQGSGTGALDKEKGTERPKPSKEMERE